MIDITESGKYHVSWLVFGRALWVLWREDHGFFRLYKAKLFSHGLESAIQDRVA